MMRAIVGLALIAHLLSGCQIPDKGRDETISWLQTQGMSQQAATLMADDKPLLRQYILDRSLAPQDDARCRSLGAAPGTPAYVQCRTAVSAGRPVQDSPRAQVAAPASQPSRMQAAEIAPSQPQQPVYQPAPGSALMNAGRSAYCARTRNC